MINKEKEINWDLTIKMADSLGIPPNFVHSMVENKQLEPVYKTKKELE